jgi:spore germination cell wall hydrolase CwlJ-like protein
LAKNIYHEARGEPVLGQLAVAQVTLNRANHTNKTICETVYHPYQFSWTLNPANYIRDFSAWLNSLELAERVLRRGVAVRNFPATHYHNLTVQPGWSRQLKYLKTINNHDFYYDHSHSYPR